MFVIQVIHNLEKYILNSRIQIKYFGCKKRVFLRRKPGK